MVTGDLHAITVNYDHLFLYISPFTMDELHYTLFSFWNKDYLGTINRITIAKRIVRNLSITIWNGKKYFTIFWYLYLDITYHKSNILCPRLSNIPLISLGQTRLHLKLLFHTIDFRTFLIIYLYFDKINKVRTELCMNCNYNLFYVYSLAISYYMIYIESSCLFLSLTDHKSIFVIIITPPLFINNNKMVCVIRYLQHLCFHYDITGTLSNELDTLNLYWNNLSKEIDT